MRISHKTTGVVLKKKEGSVEKVHRRGAFKQFEQRSWRTKTKPEGWGKEIQTGQTHCYGTSAWAKDEVALEWGKGGGGGEKSVLTGKGQKISDDAPQWVVF